MARRSERETKKELKLKPQNKFNSKPIRGKIMKRLSILLVAAMVLTTVVATANPFSDVPFSHWSYDAVNKLAARGILQGYPDGTFKGNQAVTRYALAMVTAKMLANVEQMMESGIGTNLVTRSDLYTLEKLTVEFADELALLGVKVTALEDDMQVVKEDVSMLKRDVAGIKDYMARGGMDNVKLSGDMLVRHTNLIRRNDPQNDNVLTESQVRLQFRANIDENITAVARWNVFMRDMPDASDARRPGSAFVRNAGAFGNNRIGAISTSDNQIDLAYLHIRDMFRFGGDFTFGRNFYSQGHGLLLNDYVDAIRYYKRSGDVDVVFQAIYDRHVGNYKDFDNALNIPNAVDFRNVWNLDLQTKYRDHDLYLGFYMQDEPNFMTYTDIPVPAPGLGNAVGEMKEDKRWDVEFGSRGPIGHSGHWDYDLGLVYTNYDTSIVNNAAGTLISPSMEGWMGHAAVKWDSKREWAAKLAYTWADDESIGALALDNDQRYQDGIETPYEDISRGNSWFANGLQNMTVLKLQAEYRPRDTRHYFRVAGDWLNENKQTTSNDIARIMHDNLNPTDTHSTTAGIPAGFNKVDTAYDRWNNFGISDPSAMVLTFEYRYQLAENTRIRVGYTMFDFDGKVSRTAPGVNSGRGVANDYDYNMFWTEIFSRF